MARLGADRGRELLIEQKDGGARYVVAEQDYVDGAYDPEHYAIVGYNEPLRTAKLDERGNAMMYPDSDVAIMVTTYPEVPDKEIARLNKASAEERKDADTAARETVGGQ
jgi:hypothetical protein